MGDPLNMWVVAACRAFKVAAEEAGCKVINADITLDGLKYADIVTLGDTDFHIHTPTRSFAPKKENPNG